MSAGPRPDRSSSLLLARSRFRRRRKGSHRAGHRGTSGVCDAHSTGSNPPRWGAREEGYMHRRSLAVVGAVAVLMVVATGSGFASSTSESEPRPGLALFEGKLIDLSSGWGEATACVVFDADRLAECFRDTASLHARRRRSGRMFRSWPRARRHSGSSRTPDTAAPSSTSTRAARGSTCRPGGSTTSCRRIRSVRAAHTWPRTPTAGGAGTPAVRALEPRRRRCSRAGTTASPRSTSNRRRGSLDT